MARLNNQTTVYNFGAGPACIPEQVLNQIREDIPDWNDGMSIMEISHRLPEFMALTETIEHHLRSLLAIPDDFAVLFMAGGARTQFSVIPMNLLNGASTADYIITGHWSNLAAKDAASYCQAHCAVSTQSTAYTTIPQDSELSLSQNAAYVHYTDNETIQGVEFNHYPRTEKWLVSDMTSNILTKPIDFSRFGLIYASAQKNLGIAGITVVIVRKSLLGKAHPFTPPTLNYTLSEENRSLLNTPPVFNWYVLGLVLDWVMQKGGLKVIQQEVEQKAKLLYELINQSEFYTNPVAANARSRINIPFRLPSEKLESEFLAQADKAGLKQLKGHKVVGGCRASLYNAMPISGVDALCAFMREFAKTHG